MNRREAISSLSFAGGASLFAPTSLLADVLTPKCDSSYAQAVAGTATVKIRDIKTILTAPNGIRLVIVKVETTEPSLVGWGCATFTQRALVVQTAVEQYLKPLDRKSTRLNSSHGYISYAVFCLKKKKTAYTDRCL